jgi:glyceraldehyde-3-phosphate dehydrogenase/erythrose-4-phosphate dehydrogenase
MLGSLFPGVKNAARAASPGTERELRAMANKVVVYVIGTGTIGEPLIGILSEYREALGIDEVAFHKRTPLLTDRSKVLSLVRRGAHFVADRSSIDGFREIGLNPEYDEIAALERATVVIDCTPVGNDNKQQIYTKYEKSARGFLAQGSEFGFGKPYARGINDAALRPGDDRYIQIVSCNTHNLSVLVKTIALEDGGPGNLVDGQFVCIRRANDISQDGKFVPAPEVGSHKDERFGTHHARDAYHLFKTLGYELSLYSSAMIVSTQYMHTIWFSIVVRNRTTVEAVLDRMEADDRIALTHKKSANTVFSFGRDHGHFGRILNQTVIVRKTLAVRETPRGYEVKGFCFTPQDGNPLLSSVAATCWFLDPATYEARIQALKPFFFNEV